MILPNKCTVLCYQLQEARYGIEALFVEADGALLPADRRLACSAREIL